MKDFTQPAISLIHYFMSTGKYIFSTNAGFVIVSFCILYLSICFNCYCRIFESCMCTLIALTIIMAILWNIYFLIIKPALLIYELSIKPARHIRNLEIISKSVCHHIIFFIAIMTVFILISSMILPTRYIIRLIMIHGSWFVYFFLF